MQRLGDELAHFVVRTPAGDRIPAPVGGSGLVRTDMVHPRCVDRTRANAVDVDAMGSALPRHRLRHPDHAEVRRIVGERVGAPALAGDGGHVDDFAALTLPAQALRDSRALGQLRGSRVAAPWPSAGGLFARRDEVRG